MLSAYGRLQRNNELFWTETNLKCLFENEVTTVSCDIIALLWSQACVEEAFVSASASSIFRYHLIKDHYCFAACSNSSFVRFWEVWSQVLASKLLKERSCVYSLSSAIKKKSTGTLHFIQTKCSEGRDSGKRPFIPFILHFWYPESLFSACYPYIGFLRHHCEGEVLNFTANHKFERVYRALLANFRKVITSKAVGGIKSTVLRKHTLLLVL